MVESHRALFNLPVYILRIRLVGGSEMDLNGNMRRHGDLLL
jgi:hypothetical protein